MNELERSLALIAAILTVLTLVGTLGWKLFKLIKKTGQFLDDWSGEPARPGHEATPGVVARITAMEEQLTNNGGSSMKDAVDRIERRGHAIERRSMIIERLLREHLEDGRALLEVGLENDRELWKALAELGLDVPYRDFPQETIESVRQFRRALDHHMEEMADADLEIPTEVDLDDPKGTHGD